MGRSVRYISDTLNHFSMGAWDAGIFDDDSACDILDDLEGTRDVSDFLRRSFAEAVGSDYLEYDACHAVTVSGAVLDAALHPTVDRSTYPETLNVVVAAAQRTDLQPLRPLAVQALVRVIGNGSELNELWAENEELYSTWKGNIEAIIARLQ